MVARKIERAANRNRTDPLRVGVAGAGLMGRWHAMAARRAGAVVVAIADPDRGRGAGLAAQHKARRYEDLGKMLEDAALDVLHLCTPTDTHGAAIDRALQHRCHVLAEKPLTQSAKTTENALAAAKDAGLCLAATHQYAWQRSLALVREDLGRVGDLVQVALRFHSAGGAGMPPSALLALAADILPHPLSILQRLRPGLALDRLEWRILAAGRDSWRLLAVCSGTEFAIHLSLAARPPIAEAVLLGTLGRFEVDLFHDYAVMRPGDGGRRAKIVQPFSGALRHLWGASANLASRALRRETAYPGLTSLTEAFYGACRGNQPPPMSHSELLAVARLRDRFLTEAAP